jgi:hypothetical protein
MGRKPDVVEDAETYKVGSVHPNAERSFDHLAITACRPSSTDLPAAPPRRDWRSNEFAAVWPSERAQATDHHLGDFSIAAPVFVETLVTDAHVTVGSSRGDTREKALLPAGFALTIARRILDGLVGNRPTACHGRNCTDPGDSCWADAGGRFIAHVGRRQRRRARLDSRRRFAAGARRSRACSLAPQMAG